MKMVHTRLLVANYRACFIFYRDIMGFPVEWGDEDGTYADFDAGGHILALFMREPMAEAIGAAPPDQKPAPMDVLAMHMTVAR